MAAAEVEPVEAHIKLKLSGSLAKVRAFQFLMAKIDPDWPWTKNGLRSGKLHCEECGGYIYYQPNLSADDIRALVKQLDSSSRLEGTLKVKIKRFSKSPICKGRLSKEYIETERFVS